MYFEPSAWGKANKTGASSSALRPALIFCGICIPSGAALARWGGGYTSLLGAALVVAAAALTIWQIIYFTLKDRDRLHNERHIEAKMVIGRVGINDENGSRELALPDGDLIGNPQVRAEGGE